jgi:hypothetical protein
MGIREIDSRHTATGLKFQGKEMGISKSEISPNGKVLKVEGALTGADGKVEKTVEYWDKKFGGIRTARTSSGSWSASPAHNGCCCPRQTRRTWQIEQRKAHVRTLHECMEPMLTAGGTRIVRVLKWMSWASPN